MFRHHKAKAFLRLARIWFRHVRITIWLLLLLLLVLLLYLHNIGLPGFAERWVMRAFAERGAVMEFSRIHLVWFTRIEANQVKVQPGGSPWGPRIQCRKLDLDFDPWGLLRLKLLPRQLAIDNGRLILPYPTETNGPGQLTVTNLQALIRFESGGCWFLDSLRGDLAGCDLSASGTLANADQIQDWRVLQRRADQSRGAAHQIWKAVSQVRKEIQFLSRPRLRLAFDVDGAAPERLGLWFALSVDAAASPWGAFIEPEVVARLTPMEDGACSQVDLTVQSDRVDSQWGRGDLLTFSSTFSCVAESGNLLAGRAALSAHRLDTRWFGVGDFETSLGWRGGEADLVPQMAELTLSVADLSTSLGLAEGVRLRAALSPHQGDPRLVLDLPRFLVAELEPYELSASLEVDHAATAFVAATNLAVGVHWAAPELTLTNLAVDWAGGHLDLSAGWNAISGRLQAEAASDFDPQQLSGILPREAVVWLGQFTWEAPPVVFGRLGMTLPEWGPHRLLWPGDLRPSLDLRGHFEVGEGTFQQIPLSGAFSHFSYSNMCWHLPDLVLKRPDGRLHVEHRNNDRTHEFLWSVNGAVDPTPALIVVPEEATEARDVLGTLQFGGPPEVSLAVAGSWRDASTVRGWGWVRATNFAFRGCHFDTLETRLGLTNLNLTISEPEVANADGTARADLLQFDFSRQLAFLSNGVSQMPPLTIATVIGPQVVQAIEAYKFLNPPRGRVEGVIPLKGVAGADMRFDLRGGPFHWQQFKLKDIEGRVLWREETVALTNIQSEFYGGRANGEAFFDFTGKRDADFWFNIQVEDTSLQALVADVFESTNRLEGTLGGSLSVTRANTGDFGTWFGYGNARLNDGYIWSVPVFGVLSPLLDMVVPGLGRSRATDAEGRYVITNSVIRTDDLVIHTSNMRLLYTGTVDFKGTVEAVAEAEILRDTLLVGGVVSAVLTPLSKAMIIEITGTLGEPTARPLYLLPRVLLAPLNPLKLMKDLLAPPPSEYRDLTREPQPETPGASE
jgi:hypothetical protein